MANNHQTATVHPANPRPASETPSLLRLQTCLIYFLDFCLITIFVLSLYCIVGYIFTTQPVVIIDTIKSSTSLSTVTWNLTFKVTNENFPTKPYFDHLNVSISYNFKLIAQTNIGPFAVPILGEKMIHINLSVTSAEDVGKYVVGKMLADEKNGSLVVQIHVSYAMKFKKDKKWTFASWDQYYNMVLN